MSTDADFAPLAQLYGPLGSVVLRASAAYPAAIDRLDADPGMDVVIERGQAPIEQRLRAAGETHLRTMKKVANRVQTREEYTDCKLVDLTPTALARFWQGHPPTLLTPADAGAIALIETSAP